MAEVKPERHYRTALSGARSGSTENHPPMTYPNLEALSTGIARVRSMARLAGARFLHYSIVSFTGD